MLYFGACALGRPACVQLMLQAALDLQACVERGLGVSAARSGQVGMRRVRIITSSGRCISAVLRPVLWGLNGRLDAASFEH